jgi:ubiquinone/menaquinone biosynthesis C-methylase UbiE
MTNDIGRAVAEKYDQYLGPLLFEPFAEDLAERIQGKSYTNILELACGTGRVTRHLKKVLSENSKLVATDSQAEMIKFAADSIPNEKINWQTADAQLLLFPDETFDLVVCQFGLMFLTDKMKAVS